MQPNQVNKPIQPLIWVRIVQNLVNVLRKANVFDARKLISLHSRAITDTNGTMEDLLTILKDSKKRVIDNNERKF